MHMRTNTRKTFYVTIQWYDDDAPLVHLCHMQVGENVEKEKLSSHALELGGYDLARK